MFKLISCVKLRVLKNSKKSLYVLNILGGGDMRVAISRDIKKTNRQIFNNQTSLNAIDVNHSCSKFEFHSKAYVIHYVVFQFTTTMKISMTP